MEATPLKLKDVLERRGPFGVDIQVSPMIERKAVLMNGVLHVSAAMWSLISQEDHTGLDLLADNIEVVDLGTFNPSLELPALIEPPLPKVDWLDWLKFRNL